MNIENLCRKSIEIIKEKWGIPETGFIAGGSIANIIWELVSGKEAIVNDNNQMTQFKQGLQEERFLKNSLI